MSILRTHSEKTLKIKPKNEKKTVPERVELSTSRLTVERANQLRHGTLIAPPNHENLVTKKRYLQHNTFCQHIFLSVCQHILLLTKVMYNTTQFVNTMPLITFRSTLSLNWS